MPGCFGMFCIQAREAHTEFLLKYISRKRTVGIPGKKKDE
jgi:hypothetical protein